MRVFKGNHSSFYFSCVVEAVKNLKMPFINFMFELSLFLLVYERRKGAVFTSGVTLNTEPKLYRRSPIKYSP